MAGPVGGGLDRLPRGTFQLAGTNVDGGSDDVEGSFDVGHHQFSRNPDNLHVVGPKVVLPELVAPSALTWRRPRASAAPSSDERS